MKKYTIIYKVVVVSQNFELGANSLFIYNRKKRASII